MRTLLASVSVLSLCASSLLVGCETKDCKTEEGKDAVCAESLSVFEAEEQTESADYTAGSDVTIQGLYGDIAVVGGDEATVSVTFQPFNYRGHEEEEDARREMDENLDLDVSTDADGHITISAGRHDAKNGLGAHITVALPPEFNGVLFVENDGDGILNQGNIDVSYSAEATTLNVVNHGLENCNVMRADDNSPIDNLLTNVDVRCEADITVLGVHDNVYVDSRDPAFHSDVRVLIDSISADATGGEIKGANTNVEVIFPLAGDYNVEASAAGVGARVKDVVPGDCETTASDETSADLTCGAGGPIYKLQAQDNDPDDDHNSVANVLVQ